MQFPHCDARILHAPGECTYCDMHEDWQELRAVWGINYTGHFDGTKAMCPAEVARGAGNVGGETGWPGNRPTVGHFPAPEEVEEAVESLQKIEGDLREAH